MIICAEARTEGYYHGLWSDLDEVGDLYATSVDIQDEQPPLHLTLGRMEEFSSNTDEMYLPISLGTVQLGIQLGGDATWRAMLLAGALYRDSAALPDAKKCQKAMLTAYKALDRDRQKAAVALLPELVNSRARKDLIALAPSGELWRKWKALVVEANPRLISPGSTRISGPRPIRPGRP